MDGFLPESSRIKRISMFLAMYAKRINISQILIRISYVFVLTLIPFLKGLVTTFANVAASSRFVDHFCSFTSPGPLRTI